MRELLGIEPIMRFTDLPLGIGLPTFQREEDAILEVDGYEDEPSNRMVSVKLKRKGTDLPVWVGHINRYDLGAMPFLVWRADNGSPSHE